MALPDPLYTPLFPLQEVILTKDTGEPLAAGVVTFYRDVARTVLKPVYQQVQLPNNTYSFVQINNPITLTSIGSFADDNGDDIIPFLFPYDGTPGNTTGVVDLYYITVYAAIPPVGDGALQFTREAWPPGVNGSTNPTDVFEGSDNQIANPQFVEVLFQPDVGSTAKIFSVSGTGTETQIAPDWFMRTNGTGTFTLTQVANQNASALTNPPYVLEINSSGLDQLRLVQKLTASPNLFSRGFISCCFDVATVSGGAALLTFAYVPSGTGTPITVINEQSIVGGNFTILSGTVQIPSFNSAVAPTGNVEVYLDIPVQAHIQVSSFQMVDVQNAASSTPFLQESTARQVDHLFHYYKPQLEYKPIPSYLVGWDFPLNPAQPLSSTVAAFATGANTSNYVWDQTIAFQDVNSGLSFARNTGTAGLNITASIASQCAIVQYLDAAQAREILSQRNAVALKGFISTGTLTGYINLYWTTDASLPDIKTPTFHSLVSGLTAGVPAVANGTWTPVARDTLGSPHFSLSTTNTEFSFSGWDDTASAGKTTATYFAIVISFAQIPLNSVVTLDYVSLMGGDIATRPAPQTPDQVLRECEYYYEKTYSPSVVAGTVSDVGSYSFNQNGSSSGVNPSAAPPYYVTTSSFTIPFNVIKRVIPTVHLYSPVTGTIDRVRFRYYLGGGLVSQSDVASSSWTLIPSFKNFTAQTVGTQLATGNSGITNLTGYIYCQATMDARLGVI